MLKFQQRFQPCFCNWMWQIYLPFQAAGWERHTCPAEELASPPSETATVHGGRRKALMEPAPSAHPREVNWDMGETENVCQMMLETSRCFVVLLTRAQLTSYFISIYVKGNKSTFSTSIFLLDTFRGCSSDHRDAGSISKEKEKSSPSDLTLEFLKVQNGWNSADGERQRTSAGL